MTCDELLGFLHDYVGGDLVVECRETLEVHVKGCERCGVIIQTYRHTVAVAPSGVVTVRGGKLTTYRRMAADAVDQVFPVLGDRR